ncbi:hypothetical protein R3P38DRAFT_1462942 [Favolaschia claudopus]|uniref:Uncharacterized protein n=1 Tax=Favolaschia claudopus TaxID=2862362 RepID=A0AAW0DQV1_9AGAR
MRRMEESVFTWFLPIVLYCSICHCLSDSLNAFTTPYIYPPCKSEARWPPYCGDLCLRTLAHGHLTRDPPSAVTLLILVASGMLAEICVLH